MGALDLRLSGLSAGAENSTKQAQQMQHTLSQSFSHKLSQVEGSFQEQLAELKRSQQQLLREDIARITAELAKLQNLTVSLTQGLGRAKSEWAEEIQGVERVCQSRLDVLADVGMNGKKELASVKAGLETLAKVARAVVHLTGLIPVAGDHDHTQEGDVLE